MAASAKGIAKFVIKQKAKAKLEKSDKFLKWKDFIAQDTGYVNSQEHDDAVLLHTGGTTGTPKGVLLQNSNFNALAYTCGELGCEIERSDTIFHGNRFHINRIYSILYLRCFDFYHKLMGQKDKILRTI